MTREAHIVSVRTVEVVWSCEADVRIRDDPGIVTVVRGSGVRKQTMKEEDVAFLSLDLREDMTVIAVFAVGTVNGRIEALWSIVEVLAYT